MKKWIKRTLTLSFAAALAIPAANLAFGSNLVTPRQDFAMVTGTVQSLTNTWSDPILTLRTGNTTKTYELDDAYFVLDGKTAKATSRSDVQQGDTVAVIYDKDDAQWERTIDAEGLVLHPDETKLKLSLFNTNLESADGALRLNIGSKTVILDDDGRTISANQVKNSESLVLYQSTTRSNPAQTTPELILVLDDYDLVSRTGAKYSILRDTADFYGYTLSWSGASKPITLKKDNTTLSFTIGESSYTLNGTKNTLSAPILLEDGATLIPNQLARVMAVNASSTSSAAVPAYGRYWDDDWCIHGVDRDDCYTCYQNWLHQNGGTNGRFDWDDDWYDDDWYDDDWYDDDWGYHWQTHNGHHNGWDD